MTRNKLLNVVLVQPKIGNNVGGIGRTCLAFNAALHLIGPLGFSTSDAAVRRAGLDYWKHVDVREYDSWQSFSEQLPLIARRHFFYSRFAERSILSCRYFDERNDERDLNDSNTDTHENSVALVFGSEVAGVHRLVPGDVLMRNEDRILRLPMEPDSVRSLNLTVSAGIAIYDVYRRMIEAGILQSR
jgi:tRNA (cytidine/uridine-2'-O-)-methyltransferase